MILLLASCAFYYLFYRTGWWIIAATAIVSHLFALTLVKADGILRRTLYFTGIILVIIPWIALKYTDKALWDGMFRGPLPIVVPMGISFYTLQIIAYLTDIYRKNIEPQRDFFKYLLFISFFPQILQGPIPRYERLHTSLFKGNTFEERTFTKGLHLIIWGFFLKLMIADRAALFVDKIYDNYPTYCGAYIGVAAVLYTIQLYSDFLACTSLARGASLLFGVRLDDNFKRPFLAVSIGDFWRRWHISLSTWIRDYIYIPLGGSRKGKIRRYVNLAIAFVVSGFWHGQGLRFIFWGLLHWFYHLLDDATTSVRDKLSVLFSVSARSRTIKITKRICTFIQVCLAFVVFRAGSLRIGLSMLVDMVRVYNPWVLLNGRLISVGYDWKEWMVLLFSIGVLIYVETRQERGNGISDRILKHHFPVRLAVYTLAILSIVIFGVYGYGTDAQSFIYGGF